MEALFVLALVVVALLAAGAWLRHRRQSAGAGRARVAHGRRAEALFQSMFPELQPHFHPEKVATWVSRRRARKSAPAGVMVLPPGFETARAIVEADATGTGDPAREQRETRERVRLLDSSNAVLATFVQRLTDAGAVLEVAGGRFDVDLATAADPRVRYRHGARGFRWSRKSGWKFITPVAERAIEPDDRGSRFSDDRSSSGGSSSATAAAVAGGAVLASGMGGAFAGGGASGDWETGDHETRSRESDGADMAGAASSASFAGFDAASGATASASADAPAADSTAY
jgi:uncharacterized membrane protein YgcG